MRFTRDNHLDDPFQGWKDGRNERFERIKPLFFVIVAGLFAWTVWALRRTKLLWVAMPLGLPLTMAVTNLTCYYYSMFMLAGVLVAPPRCKMAIVTWLAIFPLISLLSYATAPITGDLPIVVRVLVTTALAVPLMTYAVMPRMTRLFRRWLYPAETEPSR